MTKEYSRPVAQLVERRSPKPKVGGSSPPWPVFSRFDRNRRVEVFGNHERISMIFNIYKRGQGKYTRLSSAFFAVVIVALGCLRLYTKLEAAEFGLEQQAALWVATLVPAGVFVILGLLVVWLVNKPSVADFMIASEGEMKKVSWSSGEEIAVSTFIVIFVVFAMAVLLWVVDLIFRTFFMWLIGY